MGAKMLRYGAFAILAACILPPSVWAEPALDEGLSAREEVRFPILGFSHSGNTLLPAAEMDRVLAGFVGPEGTFSRLQEAVSTLEARYLSAGFGAVKVMLPEQDIEAGIVQVRIVEGRVGRIVVEGGGYFDGQNIRASVPALRVGTAPDMHQIDAALRIANENPAKQTRLILRPSEQLGEVDAVLRVTDERPWRVAFSADNSASPAADGRYATGRYRTGVVLQHHNLWGADHAATVQYMTSPGYESQVTIVGAGYRVPLYARGDVLEVTAGYSNVNSGVMQTVAGPVGIAGQGRVAAVKYEKYLPAKDGWQQKWVGGLEYRAFLNQVTLQGASLVPDVTVHPLALSYQGSMQSGPLDVSMQAGVLQNFAGGAKGRGADFQQTRSGAAPDYRLWRYQMVLSYLFPEQWWLRTALSGQYTRHALVPGEQFGAGGADSVRGFEERQLANDHGQRLSMELHTPNLSAAWAEQGGRLTALAFVDGAWLGRRDALPGESSEESIRSHGLGIRLQWQRDLSLRLDWAQVRQPGGNVAKGHERLHANLMLSF